MLIGLSQYDEINEADVETVDETLDESVNESIEGQAGAIIDQRCPPPETVVDIPG